jgi:rRNA methylases
VKISTKNATYQKFEVLLSNRNKRHRYNEFLIEGVRNINEAIKNNWQINSFIYPGGRTLSNWAWDLICEVKTKVNYELSASLMAELSGKEDTSELIAVAEMKGNDGDMTLSENPLIVLFDRPSNKGNLGTLIRSCDAFGADELIITGHSVDVYEPDVISASMGSFFKLPFRRLSDNSEIDEYIAGLRANYPKLKIVGTTAHKETSIYDVDMTGPVLFLIGNETDGLSQHYCEICDVMATIPMGESSAASSFNVSCAGTVMLYEAVRQRKKQKFF